MTGPAMNGPGLLQTLRQGRQVVLHVGEPTAAPSGLSVWLIHGAGGRAAQWQGIAPALQAAGHRVLALDAVGHGDSPAPRRFAHYAGPELVADLRELLARHGGARNRLVAHSYGCSQVLALLSQAGVAPLPPIDRLLLLAPAGPERRRRTPWIFWLPVPVLEWLRPQLSAGFHAAAWGDAADAALVARETAISDRNPLHVIKALFRQRLALDAPALQTVHWPVQILAGAQDGLTPAAGAQALAATLPRARIEVLLRTGHQILLERPQQVIDAILGPAD
ncbi:alpha/beta hydrolase [Aquabacterium sp. OR-4]|uniref:alpha/beta hydrolase n=1 Tax=Aquabacterium sp. OR-4 TaxID=2978127 RepID=UPI0021B3A826|nr:alpha/beta hydrolase [Aquabacterium sp. OR-4]MDT7838137.1 alpha/beta hydrolase [Aquabacterium sp. OR-4]